MLTIDQWADRIGTYLATKAGIPEEAGKVCYGIECFLVQTISLACILLAGTIVGLPGKTTLVTIAAILLKYVIGGPHFSGFIHCVGFSVFVTVGTAVIFHVSHLVLNSGWVFIITGLGILVIHRYGPLVASHRVLSPEEVRHRRLLADVFLILAAIGNIFIPGEVTTGFFIGMVPPLVFITPPGRALVDMVERTSKRP